MTTAERVETALAPPGVDRRSALEAIAEARRLYEVAESVHARRSDGSLDSAIIARRAISCALELLVTLRGEAVPDGFGKLVERARSIATAENLTTGDIARDLPVLDEMQRRCVALDSGWSLSEEDERRYDRAFVRSAEWFEAVDAYLERRLPGPGSRLGSTPGLLLGALVALSLGGAVGREFPVAAPHAAADASFEGPGFTATYYRDVLFQSPVLMRKEAKISYNWENDAPTGLALNDGFSVQWEGALRVDRRGTYRFYLTSDDGSRLRLDGKTIVDNGGAHSELTKSETVSIDPGNHPIRLDYFDVSGKALVRLEWSSDYFPRHVIGGSDLR